MATQGYVPGTTAILVNLLQRLSAWMQAEAVDIDGICEELLEQFVECEWARPVVATSVKTGMGALRRFLKAAGYLLPPTGTAPANPS